MATPIVSPSASMRAESCTSLGELVRRRAEADGNRPAYTFLEEDGEGPGTSWTWGDLDRAARALAVQLGEAGATGQRVLLCFPPGPEFVVALFACFHAGAVAVPCTPPGSRRTWPRLVAIALDSAPVVLLTSVSYRPRAEEWSLAVPALASVRWIAVDPAGAGPGADPGHGSPFPARAEDLALLQYTSGSTSEPRGVKVTHGQVLANERMIRAAFQVGRDSRIVGWLPFHHDMGLMGNLLQPLFAGASCVLLPPAAFLQRPAVWLRAITRFGGTVSGGPNFAYDECVRRISPAERAGLDLSTWESAFNGAEPVRAATLDRFAEAFAPHGFRRSAFRPCYGLAEATLLVAAAGNPKVIRVRRQELERGRVEIIPAAGDGAGATIVSCGEPAAGLSLRIVDGEHGTAVAEDTVGEIWVAGPSVAEGYWRQPEATSGAFAVRLESVPEGRFLRTGDLGFMHDGELHVTGRIKDLLILRGRNHYPQDIERAIEECHPALRPAGGAAFAVDAGGEERLVVVHEVERRAARGDLEDIVRAIRRAVGESLELQAWGVVLLPPGGLPRTTSGKVRRRACARSFNEGRLEALVTSVLAAEAVSAAEAPPGAAQDARARLVRLEPRRREEALLERLVDVVARVARIDLESVDPTLGPAALGVDSLGAVELRSALETAAGPGVTLAEILDGRSVAELARLAAERFDAGAGASRATEFAASSSSPAALSEGQRSLWFLQRLDPASAAYNVGFAARLDSSTDLDAFEEAFRHLVDRHDALRSLIEAPDGEPRRHVDPAAPFSPLRHDASGWSDDELRCRVADVAHRPFDLARGPLVRLELFTGPAGPVAVFVVHHVAVDFWSVMVLADELRVLYEAARAARDPARGRPPELPPPRARYADFVAWQRALLDRPEGRALAERAGRGLVGASPTLDLPTDRPRLAVRTGRGGSVPLRLDVALSAALRDLARRESTTLFTVLVAALGSLLGRYAGQSDVIVGTPTSGRSAAVFENVVGYFANLVPVRLDLGDDPDLGSVVARARAAVLEALALQDLPFPVLVEQLRIARDPGRPPLVQAVLALERPHRLADVGLAPFVCGAAGERRVLGGLGLTPFPLEKRTVPFDLTVLLVDEGGSLEGAIQYDGDLFDRTRIERLATDYGRVLRAFVEEPGRRIGELPLAAAPEGHRPRARGDAAAPAPAGGNEPMEGMIAGIWRDTLGLERVGIDENFFDLGGHSLLLARVHAQLCRRLGREVPIVELFAHPTIRALARHLAGEAPASAPVAAGVERARLRRQALQRRSARTEGSAP